ncbi:DUF4097 family beta strand repeat-containing protein [Streptomyces lydicus]|uniref:DUF4097 family beta strand repeat-containing protein n=1 Tax=Streptomyces lydicus TaxID=47763 RepID=UPI0033CA551C
MHLRVRTIGAAALVCAGTLGIGACGLLPGKTFRDDAVVPKKITAVRVDSAAGDVTLRGGTAPDGPSSGTAGVHRSVTYHGHRPERPTHRVEDGVLVLGGCGDGCSVDYTVALPAGLPVSGQTSNGELDLSRVGAVDVRTGSGAVELDAVTGPVDVRTSNGRITGRALSGSHIDAETTNGEIDLTPATPQSIRAKTSNGSVTVRVPEAHYRVSARTSSGDKDISVPDDPSGTLRLDLTTDNGDITAGTTAS